MHAVLARESGRPFDLGGIAIRAGVQAIMVVAAAAAHAADARQAPSPQFQLAASPLPRFGGVDATNRASRFDLTFVPTWRSGLGLTLGISRPGTPNALAPYAPGGHAVDLGVQWRYALDSHYLLDVTAWRRMQNADALSLIESREPAYGARVEMGMASGARKGFVADRGFVGVQLEGGARITVKRSGGRPMIYYRNTF